MTKLQQSTEASSLGPALRRACRKKRILVTRNMAELLRLAGIKRTSKHVGNAIYDNEVTTHLVPISVLAAFVCMLGGHKTVQPYHLEHSMRHLFGIEPMPAWMMTGKAPPAHRKKPSI